MSSKIALTKLTLDNFTNVACAIGSAATPGDIYLLYGDLGAGKTTFVQAFAQGAGVKKHSEVSSPTFNIVHIYDAAGYQIAHVDLYRINSEREIDELGIDEAYTKGVVLIEWPQKLASRIPKNAVRIFIDEHPADQTLRDIIIEGSRLKYEDITT